LGVGRSESRLGVARLGKDISSVCRLWSGLCLLSEVEINASEVYDIIHIIGDIAYRAVNHRLIGGRYVDTVDANMCGTGGRRLSRDDGENSDKYKANQGSGGAVVWRSAVGERLADADVV
jgi:hypothetical protein